MMHQFTHRWAGYGADGRTQELSEEALRDAAALPLPRYWVDEREVAARLDARWPQPWLMGFRSIARGTDERTVIMSVIPRAAVSGKLPLLLPEGIDARLAAALLANSNALVFDWAARQKVGGTDLAFFALKQLPVLPPGCYTEALLDFIAPRVLELVYTADDLAPFARALGYEGPPFAWEAARRFTLRCELDALYFHLYGLERAQAAQVLESFPIVRRKDERAHGHFRTRDAVLANYEEMAGLPALGMPAPRGEGEVSAPDVRLW